MFTYAITARGNYGGGMAIVSANNEKDAKYVASRIKDSIWFVRYAKPDNIELLPCICDGNARVLTHFEYGE